MEMALRTSKTNFLVARRMWLGGWGNYGLICGCRRLLFTIKQQVDDILSTSLVSERKTKALCQRYEELDRASRLQFLAMLAKEYSVDHNSVGLLAEALSAAKRERDDVGVTLKIEERLRQALSPRYHQLFTHISRLDSGVKFLVDLRADLLATLVPASGGGKDGVEVDVPHMQAMNASLRDLLSLCFSVGFLRLERVTWQSPCDMLEKVSEYEAVHPIRSWTDVKQRVGAYRRCYVFTHHSMPREPVVVLHTALTSEIAASIQSIVQRPRGTTPLTPDTPISEIDPSQHQQSAAEDTSKVNTAIFYSITSTLKGLQGVELGNYLIKSAVRDLLADIPHLSQFSTLSPIPGFRDWLVGALLRQGKNGSSAGQVSLFTDSELVHLAGVLGVDSDGVLEALRRALVTNSWAADDSLASALRLPLLRHCAHYLYNEKRRGFALNPVANFHLRNGAVMWRLNWLADRTARGLTSACGLMVNYRYMLDQTENNSRLYAEKQHIAVSDQFTQFLQR